MLSREDVLPLIPVEVLLDKLLVEIDALDLRANHDGTLQLGYDFAYHVEQYRTLGQIEHIVDILEQSVDRRPAFRTEIGLQVVDNLLFGKGQEDQRPPIFLAHALARLTRVEPVLLGDIPKEVGTAGHHNLSPTPEIRVFEFFGKQR